eukprot:UN05781
MPFNTVTGAAARQKGVDNKTEKDKVITDKMDECRYWKKMYSYNYDDLQNAFHSKYSYLNTQQNYPTPCADNL